MVEEKIIVKEWMERLESDVDGRRNKNGPCIGWLRRIKNTLDAGTL